MNVVMTESQKALVLPLERFEDAQPGLVYKLKLTCESFNVFYF